MFSDIFKSSSQTQNYIHSYIFHILRETISMQQKQCGKLKKKKRVLLLTFHNGNLSCWCILLFLQKPYLGLQWSRIYLLAKTYWSQIGNTESCVYPNRRTAIQRQFLALVNICCKRKTVLWACKMLHMAADCREQCSGRGKTRNETTAPFDSWKLTGGLTTFVTL